MERFGKPGRTLLGSDSHTPAAGSLGMLAMGAGGLEVALAMAGEPVYLRMPSVVGVQLTGRLPDCSGHGPACDRQHGDRTGGHDHGFPVR